MVRAMFNYIVWKRPDLFKVQHAPVATATTSRRAMVLWRLRLLKALPLLVTIGLLAFSMVSSVSASGANGPSTVGGATVWHYR